MSEYTEQAEKFLEETKTEFKISLLGTFEYFPDDKEKRDVYEFTFSRNGKTFSGRFGQSLAKTEERAKMIREYGRAKKPTAPTAYDVLACLTTYDPGTFSDFCDEFGYDADSRKALTIYEAVCKEWDSVRKLWGDCLESLQEIN